MASLGSWISGSSFSWLGEDQMHTVNARLKVDLISQNASTNTSVIRYTSALYKTQGSENNYSEWFVYDTCAGAVLYNDRLPIQYTGTGLYYCITRNRTITHDANGNASFSAYHGYGTPENYTASVGGTYTLPQINRQASIGSVDDFVVGSNTLLRMDNPASYWLNLEFWVWNGSGWEPRILNKQIGQALGYMTDFTSAEISAIYTQLGNATVGTGLFRLRTYTDAGYTNQLGNGLDKQVTLTVDVGQRDAYITNTPNFVVGQNVNIQIHNPRNYWLKLFVYLHDGSNYGNPVASFNIGQVSSHTTAFTQAQIDAMYYQFRSLLSGNALFRIQTFSDSGYTVRIGYDRDKIATATINTAINTPTFTNYDIISENKTITVKDSYNNTLGTTQTNTLTGSNQKVISGVSQIKASITVANKMVAKNQANPVRYRLVNDDKLVEASYKASETVNLLIDNITSKDAVVTAYDSRGLATPVSKSFTNIANYTSPTAWSLAFTRDNNVDEKTKLSIAGKFWKQYFGGGTSGVQNTITAHYRYKETTQAWGSQTWNTLAVTSNAEGDISFNNYINGDLGVNGFNKDKSYSVEVRLYDKISALIVSGVLSKGTPLLDWTIDGVAIKGKYNPLIGGSLQVDGRKLLDWFYPIGTIYETTSSDLDTTTKMGTYFGGTWEAYGSGRVLVGKSADTEFDTIGETGGAKTHTLQVSEMPSHNHTVVANIDGPHGFNQLGYGGADAYIQYYPTNSVGGGGAHNNLQPYIVVYRYRRTA